MQVEDGLLFEGINLKLAMDIKIKRTDGEWSNRDWLWGRSGSVKGTFAAIHRIGRCQYLSSETAGNGYPYPNEYN